MLSRPGSRFGGCHVLAQLSGVDAALADDTARLRSILLTALSSAGATVCGMLDKRFAPHGVTVVALLTESHASIHSYPERGAMFVDVFTCGDAADAEHAVRLLCKELGAHDVATQTVFRGSGKEIVEPLAPGLTRNWALSEVICDVHTEFQHLVIGRTEQGVALFSDGERQSTEFSQLTYHEALVVPAFLLAPQIERVLVIGSGEGVVSQLAVAAGASHVDHVDIDSGAVRLCAEHLPYGYSPAQLRQAENGVGPITVHYRDGFRFVEETTASYDVVVIDGPDERTDPVQHNRLYGADFLQQCARIGAVTVSQAGCPTLWRNAGLQRSWQRFGEHFGSRVYFGSAEHEWAFLSGLGEPLADPVATMQRRWDALVYRPRTIDAESLAASAVPPLTLRTPTR
jgi:spermidine synthase